MLDYIKHVVGMNAEYARMHTEDIPPEQWTVAPEGFSAHPASILTHLVAGHVWSRRSVGDPAELPADWPEAAADTSAAELDPDQYPPEDALLAALNEHRAALLAAFEAASPEDLAQPLPDEQMRQFIPTVGAMFLLSLTVHESMHLGQLAAWRRATGLPLHI